MTPAAAPVFAAAPAEVVCRPRPAAYAVIFGTDGRVAVVSGKGAFWLPGGGSLPGETPDDTVRREVGEELGRVIRLVRRIGEAVQYFHAGEEGWYRMTAVFFLADLDGDARHAGEHELHWLDPRRDGEQFFHLAQVLDFFLAPHRGQSPGIDEMLVVFLSQIGFWEWELDNLLYAFTPFDERSQAWDHENGIGIANALRTQGIWIRLTAVKGFKARRQARAGRRRAVFAPVDELNRVIGRWNQLLDLCEERVLVGPAERQEAVALGAQVLPDLCKFRKAPLGEG